MAKSNQHLNLVGLGDSLTHGVGDATNSGGYVPLIKADIEASGSYTVATQNFGVTGNTTPQILHRVQKQSKLRSALANADVITLTAGGNDLMAVLQKHFLDITTGDVSKGIIKFDKNLDRLLTAIRQLNPNAPVYVFSIYNPFYVYFPNLTAMTKSVARWNDSTDKLLAAKKRMYFVDINQVLSTGKTQTTSKKTKQSLQKGSNTLIFSQDHFHPNNAGYAQMTKKLWAKMQATESTWRH